MDKTKGIITGSLVMTMIVGVLNSIYKQDKLPNFRFFFGTGVLFLFLSLLADAEEEIAKALALAILTFTLLGEGGGVLDHFLGGDASKTTLNTNPSGENKTNTSPSKTDKVNVVTISRPENGLPTVVSKKELTPVKPIIPNGLIQTVFPGLEPHG